MASIRASVLTASSGRVKEARKLARRAIRVQRGQFLAEGWKSVEAALEAECVEEVFATAEAAGTYETALADTVVHLVDERGLASLTDTVTPQGIVAVCRWLDAATWPPAASVVVVCADVRDPGNAGTIIRTADALGADAVVLAGHSVDPYNPKTIRATVGSLFHIPVVMAPDPAAVIARLRADGLVVLAAEGTGESSLEDPSVSAILREPHAWVFGNEAWGLPPAVAEAADLRVSIPMAGRAESLNLSTAAAICLYASSRAG